MWTSCGTTLTKARSQGRESTCEELDSKGGNVLWRVKPDGCNAKEVVGTICRTLKISCGFCLLPLSSCTMNV